MLGDVECVRCSWMGYLDEVNSIKDSKKCCPECEGLIEEISNDIIINTCKTSTGDMHVNQRFTK